MPRVKLASWLVELVAALEREYGKADLLIGVRRDWAVTELNARRKIARSWQNYVIFYVGDGVLVVHHNGGAGPVVVVRLDTTADERLV